MTSKQVFLDTPLLKRGGAGKMKGRRSRRMPIENRSARRLFAGLIGIEVVTDGRVYGFRGPFFKDYPHADV